MILYEKWIFYEELRATMLRKAADAGLKGKDGSKCKQLPLDVTTAVLP